MFLKIKSQLDVDLCPRYKKYEWNETTQCTICRATCIQRIVSKYMYFSEKMFYQIATVLHARTRSDMVEYCRTDILLKNFCTRLNTVVHARIYDCTRLHKIDSYCTRSHRRLCTVEHGRTGDRTRSQTVAQTTAHGRTKNLQLPEWPTLK